MTHPFFLPEADATVGANLRRRREDLGLAVEPFAARLGLPPERIAAAEAGAHLTACELLLLVARLHCGLDALFADPPPPRLP